jgi:hypothetical protein
MVSDLHGDLSSNLVLALQSLNYDDQDALNFEDFQHMQVRFPQVLFPHSAFRPISLYT